MNTKWYVGCKNPDEKDERKHLYQSCHQILKVLRAVIEKDMEEVQTHAESQSNYELAAWPYLQADRLGTIRALKNVLELLPPEEKK